MDSNENQVENPATSTPAVSNHRGGRTPQQVEFKGETLTHKQWAEKLGMGQSVISSRLARGWSPERTFTTPIGPQGGGISKTDGCRFLDSTPKENLPASLAGVLAATNGPKFGDYAYRHHRKEFDRWFETEFKPSKQNESKG